ncbi:MAG: NAD(P)H-dependent oxidoreductase subunit E [Spirochaetes bacterium]|jgi:NADH-quinone oxidoreductase E subunit|nr:NAD(P)H-dependent oxidoreductase subunit E [Spirochaetota bacterium]
MTSTPALHQNSAEQQELLHNIVDSLKDQEGALIPILQAAQDSLGFLSTESLKTISKLLNMPYSEISGVVSFYSYFTTMPRGRYTIRVCLGTACYVRGGKQLLEELKKILQIEVGETTEDKLFSLEVGRCFGACGLAPVLMINDEIHQRVKPTKLAALLAPYKSENDSEATDESPKISQEDAQ